MAELSYIEQLLVKARKAQSIVEGYTQEQVDALVKAMGKIIYDNAEMLAREAVEESGYGRVTARLSSCSAAPWAPGISSTTRSPWV